MRSINPLTGKVICEYEPMTGQMVDGILRRVANSWEMWKFTSFSTRTVHMKKLARILESKKEELAILMADEMGKKLSDGIAEIEKCASVCDYYADNAEMFLKTKHIETEAESSYVAFRPLGVVLAVMPWNFPFWQVFRFAAPAIMAGNGAVLKHASNVSGCGLAIEEMFREAGFPDSIFRTLLIPSEDVEKIIRHDIIKAVTLTGSTPAGKSVAAIAGDELKKCVLELGGSDPYIILKDANLDLAVEACVTSRLINVGQSCIAAKRFIAVEEVYDAFLEKMVAAMKDLKLGSPHEEDTDISPMARPDLRDELHEQVKRSIKSGANCVLGGEIPQMDGAFYPPTVLGDVIPGMPAFDEELFGPVAAVVRALDQDEAIQLANQTIYGLGGAVFTENEETGKDIAENYLDAGCCFVNEFVRSDPRLPFGGIKQSGFGRELGPFGIHEFINLKTVYIK